MVVGSFRNRNVKYSDIDACDVHWSDSGRFAGCENGTLSAIGAIDRMGITGIKIGGAIDQAGRLFCEIMAVDPAEVFGSSDS